MATYKVLQDIEAEDKLIGPLTLKQFIFAIITLVLMFIAFMMARVNGLLVIPWLPPIFFFGFMASPIGRDQPNDVWLAARIRFLIKPRKRVWDQSGMTELITITAPKKEVIQRTNGLNQYEVKSRLNALASTLDSRGWAVKNISVNMFTNPGYVTTETSTERLIDITNIPQEVPNVDVHASDDILDPMNNMVAQRFDSAIKKRQQDHIDELKVAAQKGNIPTYKDSAPIDYSVLEQHATPDPGYTTFGAQVVLPGATAQDDAAFVHAATPTNDEEEFVKQHVEEEKKREHYRHAHERTIETTEQKRRHELEKAKKAAEQKAASAGAPDGILKELGQTGGDLSVASIASLARHAEQEAALHDNDVISLH